MDNPAVLVEEEEPPPVEQLPLHSSEEEEPAATAAAMPERDVMNHVRVVSHRERHIQRFNSTWTEYTIEIDDSDLSFGDFHALFDTLVDWITQGFLPDDCVGIQLTMTGLKNTLFLPFSHADQITGQHLLDLLEKIVQSNDEVRPTAIEIKVIRVQLPNGGGSNGPLRRQHSIVGEFLKQKRCIVTVSDSQNLCFARCLAL